jgi:plastocyanin
MNKRKPGLPSLAALMICALANPPASPLFAEEISASSPIEVRIISTEFKYVPAKVGVTVGRTVTFILDNSNAETEHGVIVPAFGFRLEAKAGEVVRTTIVFDRPGEYEFTCDLPGHREAGMKGTLIVAGL